MIALQYRLFRSRTGRSYTERVAVTSGCTGIRRMCGGSVGESGSGCGAGLSSRRGLMAGVSLGDQKAVPMGRLIGRESGDEHWDYQSGEMIPYSPRVDYD